MKAIVKNGQNHEMYLLIDIDITEQAYRLVNQILENHYDIVRFYIKTIQAKCF